MLFFLVSNIALLALCTSLRIPSQGSLADTPAPLINIILPLAADPPASSNDIHIHCQGTQYGTGLSYSSCLDAFATFTRGAAENPVTIGRRRTGKYTQNVPWRWVSGDGRCTFDINIRGRPNFETTTGVDIARAAWKLMNECVRDQGGKGGVLQNLGRRGSLAITIRSYSPINIQCGTRPQDYGQNKCHALLNTLPADVAPTRTWGPRGDADVDINIPHAWQLVPPYHNCRVEIIGATRSTRDEMTFYDMWEAGVMLAGICGRIGRAGKFANLGMQRSLNVVLDDGYLPPPVSDREPKNTTILTLDGSVHDRWDDLPASA